MQAIITKYFGPTNSRGSRLVAKCEAGSITVPYDHALDTEGNHRAAAKALCNKLGWKPNGTNRYAKMVCGALPNGHGYAHVFVDE